MAPRRQRRGQRSAALQGAYDLPDIITELQEATSLTRKTIIDILLDSGRLAEFIGNPNDFIQMVKGRLQTVLAEIVTEGIQYEKIGGYVYELRELQKDGQEEKDRFLDQMYKLQNPEKSDFDYVVYDSEPERQFAELLDGRERHQALHEAPRQVQDRHSRRPLQPGLGDHQARGRCRPDLHDPRDQEHRRRGQAPPDRERQDQGRDQALRGHWHHGLCSVGARGLAGLMAGMRLEAKTTMAAAACKFLQGSEQEQRVADGRSA